MVPGAVKAGVCEMFKGLGSLALAGDVRVFCDRGLAVGGAEGVRHWMGPLRCGR